MPSLLLKKSRPSPTGQPVRPSKIPSKASSALPVLLTKDARNHHAIRFGSGGWWSMAVGAS